MVEYFDWLLVLLHLQQVRLKRVEGYIGGTLPMLAGVAITVSNDLDLQTTCAPFLAFFNRAVRPSQRQRCTEENVAERLRQRLKAYYSQPENVLLLEEVFRDRTGVFYRLSAAGKARVTPLLTTLPKPCKQALFELLEDRFRQRQRMPRRHLR